MPSREPLTDTQISEALSDLPGWSAEGDTIVRSVEVGDFREAVALIVRIGFEAEQMNHHPEITNVYNRVRLALSTHDADNRVTELDTDLAQRINSILPTDAASA